MIRISLLGRVAVSVDGTPVEGEAAQRRRLALLALLVTPGLRPVRRDQLVGYLWPEREEESARHLLSVALHVLRKALGNEAVLTTTDEVGLNPALVEADVLRFDEALDRGDPEAALAVADGPFMEGFLLGDVGAFDDWADARRREHAHRLGRALEEVAARRTAAGDAAGAVDAWKRRAALDPYSGRVTAGLMTALATAGDRAAALRQARIHAQLLEAEFGTKPGAAVTELEEALREGSWRPAVPAPAAAPTAPAQASPAAPPAAEHPGAPTEATAKDDAAPGPDQDRPVPPDQPAAAPPAAAAATPAGAAAPSGDAPVQAVRPRRLAAAQPWPPWAGVAATLTVAVLLLGPGAAPPPPPSPAPTVRLVVRPFAEEPAPPPGDDFRGWVLAQAVHAELARHTELELAPLDAAERMAALSDGELADALQARFVLSAVLVAEPDRFSVLVLLADAERGDTLWEGTYPLPDRELARLARDVPQDMLPVLRERVGLPPEAPLAVVPVVARDSAVERLYYDGSSLLARRTAHELEEAARLLERAVTLDSTYTAAHAALAIAWATLGGYDYGVHPPDSAYGRSRAAARAALALDSTSALAHAALAVVHMNFDWDWEGAAREYQAALRFDPGNAQVRAWYALLLDVRGDPEGAEAQLTRAVESDATDALLRTSRAHHYYYVRDFARALAEVRRALDSDSTFVRAHLLEAMILLQDDRAQHAVAILQSLDAAAPAPEPVVEALLAVALARQGEREGAKARLERLQLTQRQRYVPFEYIAIARLALGDEGGALNALAEARRRRSGGMIYLPVEPLVDALRKERRFQALLREVHGG